MGTFAKALACLGALSISTASFCYGSISGSAQDSYCTEINEVAMSCVTIPSVNVEREKPFISERMVQSSARPIHEKELVARDSAGRIRLEQHISHGQAFLPSEILVCWLRTWGIQKSNNSRHAGSD